MKTISRFIATAGLVLAIATPVFAQQQPLTQDQIQQLQQKITKDVSEQVANSLKGYVPQAKEQQEVKQSVPEQKQDDNKKPTWSGVGHEIGTAVNESLSAVTSNAQAFSKTGVGEMTIGLVVWKVAGGQVTQFVGGLVLMFMTAGVFSFFYWRNCTTRRICIKSTKEGKEWVIVNDGTQNSSANGEEPMEDKRAWHIIPFVVFTLISAIMVGCVGSGPS